MSGKKREYYLNVELFSSIGLIISKNVRDSNVSDITLLNILFHSTVTMIA